jgi:hypothetical protein
MEISNLQNVSASDQRVPTIQKVEDPLPDLSAVNTAGQALLKSAAMNKPTTKRNEEGWSVLPSQ